MLGQAVAGMVAIPMLRSPQPAMNRVAACLGVLCLLPLMLLGAMWPSLLTVLAIVGCPALLTCLLAVAVPKVLRSSPVRWYVVLSLVLALTGSVAEIGWLHRSDSRVLHGSRSSRPRGGGAQQNESISAATWARWQVHRTECRRAGSRPPKSNGPYSGGDLAPANYLSGLLPQDGGGGERF